MRLFILFSFLALILFSACGYPQKAIEKTYSAQTESPVPNYSQIQYWAAHPYKTDPADSVPATLKHNYQPDSTVDIFFIHPTTYIDEAKTYGWNAPINQIDINYKTDNSTILYQASIFNEAGRVFAPRYRQAVFSAYFPKNLADSTAAMNAFNLAYSDIKTAFEYYLSNYNNGKPIVIAAHSQGSTHGKRLLKDFFDTTNLRNQLIVAYLVGMPIEYNYFTQLKACIKPEQTGCICSWRTYKTGYTPNHIIQEKETAIVTNPITWEADKPVATRQLNKGGILMNFNKVIPSVTNAVVQGNILWSNKPKFFGNILYTTKNYHIGDMNLYYLNIRENMALRKKAFLQKQEPY